MRNKTFISLVISMKKNITVHPNSSVIISLVLILIGTGMPNFVSISFAQQSCWIEKAEMSTARIGHSSCVLDGKIYTIGGAPNNQDPAIKTMEVYDPILNIWVTKADLLTARTNFASYVINGKIYAVGGGKTYWWTPIKTIEEYDPQTDTWTHKADMPRARMGLTASLVNGKIYIIGGANANEISFAEVDVYDPLTDTWSTASNLPTPRFNLVAAVVNGKIYVIGGHIKDYQNWIGLRTVEEYDPATDIWTIKANMITGRKYFTASVLNGKIYVFGGSPGHLGYYLSSVEEYDPGADTWVEKTEIPSVLVGASSVSYNNKIFVIGGSKAPPAVSTLYEYDPSLDPIRVDVELSKSFVPMEFRLAQNYPNPFNPSTMIHYQLPITSEVELGIYNLLGQKMITLVSEKQPAGTYKIEWHARDLSSGIYLVRLHAGGPSSGSPLQTTGQAGQGFVRTRKLVLQK